MTRREEDQALPTQHNNRNNNNKDQNNDEIWALLNYSKVRLATGTTPRAADARDNNNKKKARNDGNDDVISDESYQQQGNGGGMEESDNFDRNNSDSGNDDDDNGNDDGSFPSGDGEDGIPHPRRPFHDQTLVQQIMIKKNVVNDELENDNDFDEHEDVGVDVDDDDIYSEDDKEEEEEEVVEEDEEDDDDEEEIDHAEIAASRARAMAALARTRDLYGTMEDDDMIENDANEYNVTGRREYQNTTTMSTPISVATAHGSETLTEKQLLKSMALAEREAQRGASDFSTTKKLHLVNQMSTPKGKDGFGGIRFHGKQQKNLEGRNKKDLAIGSEIKKIGQRAQGLWNVSKMRAEKAVKEIKMNVAKIERRQQKHSIRATTIAAAGTSPRSRQQELNKDSPLKKFTDTIAKVERMNEQKYGHEIHFV